MKCGDNKQYSKSKVQKKNTEHGQNEHLSLQKPWTSCCVGL